MRCFSVCILYDRTFLLLCVQLDFGWFLSILFDESQRSMRALTHNDYSFAEEWKNRKYILLTNVLLFDELLLPKKVLNLPMLSHSFNFFVSFFFFFSHFRFCLWPFVLFVYVFIRSEQILGFILHEEKQNSRIRK